MFETNVDEQDFINKQTYIRKLAACKKCLDNQMSIFLGPSLKVPDSGLIDSLNHAAWCFKEALGAAMQCNQTADTSVGKAFESLKDWDKVYSIRYRNDYHVDLKQINILNKLIKTVDKLLTTVIDELDDTLGNTRLTLNDWSISVKFKQVFDYFNELENLKG